MRGEDCILRCAGECAPADCDGNPVIFAECPDGQSNGPQECREEAGECVWISGCEASDYVTPSDEILSNAGLLGLVGEWAHAYEEEAPDDEVRVFRPGSHADFPPSPFRAALRIAADGTCEHFVLHPSDAHYFEDCSWRIDVGAARIEFRNAQGVIAEILVTETSAEILSFVELSGRV